jgi:hypothetical protein
MLFEASNTKSILVGPSSLASLPIEDSTVSVAAFVCAEKGAAKQTENIANANKLREEKQLYVGLGNTCLVIS